VNRALLVLLAISVLVLPAAVAREPDGTLLVQVPAGALHQARQAGLRPLRTLDYGSFAWLELAETDLLRLQAMGLPFELQEDPYRLQLGGQSFDPLRDGVLLPPGWQSDSPGEGGPDLHLVQLVGPTRAEWLATLSAGGLEVVRYVHPYTYVAWGDDHALAQAEGHAFVRWTGAFESAFRLNSQEPAVGEAAVQVNVLLYRGADADQVQRRMKALDGELGTLQAVDRVLALAPLRLPAPALRAAARIPGVYSIQVVPTDGGLRGEMSNQVNVNNVGGTNLAFPGYRQWLASVGLDGSGVILANVDDGIRDTHLDLAGRMAPCSGLTCGGSAAKDHGTHTAGIMAADGTAGVLDGGFLRGLGMAPGAKLVEQLFDPTYKAPAGMRFLMTESYRNGASISGNSWGSANTPQGYDLHTMQVDIGVRDADPEAPGNQPLAYILSIMNGQGGTSTQGAPDEAKNTLTVGSTYMQLSSGEQMLNIGDLSWNTAHGPALDGRKIPHLVAPGWYVDSTSAGSDSSYLLRGGTSMASPQVAGAAALFVQYYRTWRGINPSPALIKAAFLAVAHDLAGHLDADGNVLGHPFDSKQGWGRLDVAAVLDPSAPVYYFDQLGIFDDTGQVWQREFLAADSSLPVRLMLAWTDAPGHGQGGTTPAWNNNLDLVVEAGGQTYRGNAFGTDGWSLAGGGADYMNNTEGVFLPSGGASPFAVRVVASNINSDGVPNYGYDTDQDFALVCYNCLPSSGPPQVIYLPIMQN
jgi:serine protease AprX